MVYLDGFVKNINCFIVLYSIFFSVCASETNIAHAAESGFSLPIRCQPGIDCWLVNTVDRDPGKGVRDYQCGSATYDGHKGTDIAIRDIATMARGVEVLAAAPGQVLSTRDGMADIDFRKIGGHEAVKGRECGNGVVLNHGDGWTTQYCHLRRDSVAVSKGQRVGRGQRLGFVGHSGLAQFPHVHITVRRGKQVVDPFVGLGKAPACGPGPRPLWSVEAARALTYPPLAVYGVGFAAQAPKADAIRRGFYRDEVLSKSAKALILWAEIFRTRAGDEVVMTITGPSGEAVLDLRKTLEKGHARRLLFAGRKRKPLFWSAGDYKGEITIVRKTGPGGGKKVSLSKSVTIR